MTRDWASMTALPVEKLSPQAAVARRRRGTALEDCGIGALKKRCSGVGDS
jgi:hypothetical protein